MLSEMRTIEAASDSRGLMALLCVCAGLLTPAGCGSDAEPTTTEGTTGDDSEASSTDPAQTTASDPTTTSATSSSSSDAMTGTEGTTGAPDPTGFDPPDPVCGDGFVEGDEQCDDGNDVDEDGCTNACLIPCGVEWSALEPAPTLESTIEGLHIARDESGDVLVAGRVKEVIVDQEDNVIEGPDSIMLLRYSELGELLWSQTITAGLGDAFVAGLVALEGDEFAVAATIEGADGEDVWVGRFAGDGAELWTYSYDSMLMESDDQATGLAAAPNGDLVVSGRVTVAEQDTDIWIAKLDGALGEELWTSSYTGEFNNGYSVDRAGPVAVASDGTVYVSAHEFVDYQTSEGTLIRFAADGSGPEWSFAPKADGTPHDHTAGPIAIDSEDNVVFAVVRPGVGSNFWIYKVDAQQEVLWTRERNDFKDMDYSWLLTGFGVSDDDSIVVSGYWTNEIPGELISWLEGWWARLDSGGAIACQLTYQEPTDELLPPSLAVFDVAATPEGGALLTGEQNIEGEQAIWTARFRP